MKIIFKPCIPVMLFLQNKMMKNILICFLPAALLFTGITVHAQDRQPSALVSFRNLLPGYIATTGGEEMRFHSSDPNIRNGLVTRCTDGKKFISWKTAAIPADYRDKYIYFIWLAGYGVGNSARDDRYDFYINDEKAFTLKTNAQDSVQNWELKNEEDAALSFRRQPANNGSDCFGYMVLKVPVNNYKKGEPLLLKMVGEAAGRQDWYITFIDTVREKAIVSARPLLKKNNNAPEQLVEVSIHHILPQEITADITAGNGIKKQVVLKQGINDIELWVPAVNKAGEIPVSIDAPGALSFKKDIPLQPVALREIYLVPHSHNDIGYSDLQTVVEQKQDGYLRHAMQLIAKTKDYPSAAQSKWNIESLWALENFMGIATAAEKKEFFREVKDGAIGLPADYCNLLTGACRPEELIHWTDYAGVLHHEDGISFKSIMISDVPGMSWAAVSALAQRGIRYISSGPNYVPNMPYQGDRVGYVHSAWGDKPFYWVSASGLDTVLFWQAGKGYSWFHNWLAGRVGPQTKNNLMNYMQELEDKHYPYNMVQLRYTIIADNGPPDENLPDFVKQWNAQYASPRLVISNVNDMMQTFERRYAKKIPVVSGDYTPYWEDGIMSSAAEEVLVKHSVERLYQSEVLNTLLFPGNYDEQQYYRAWRNVVMWHEHTWGAANSISQPDAPNVAAQWKYKQRFALEADTLSRALLDKTIHAEAEMKNGFEVVNTSSWKRNGLVILTKEQSADGDRVTDANGKDYPSQRLSDGSLAFLAKAVPALGSKRFYVKKGSSNYRSNLKISGSTIENNFLRLTVDENTGAIKSLINKQTGHEFVDHGKWAGLNQYVYVPGRDPSQVVTVKDPVIKIKDHGPLVATIAIISKAPGTNQLVQTISLVNELNKVAITDWMDKTATTEKESVHFAFPVNLPGGQLRMDMGTGILTPEKDQLPGADKDYVSMQYWADVSGNKEGITVIPQEVPLIEEGKLIDEVPVNGVKKWKEQTDISTTFFSYAMNNYWHTNYKASQEGPVAFHYAIYLHDRFDPAVATREGMANDQPLLVSAAAGKTSLPFNIDDQNIIVTAVKPAISGHGIILRLYNAASRPETLHLSWNKAGGKNKPGKIYISNANEDKLSAFDLTRPWPAFAVKTLYISL